LGTPNFSFITNRQARFINRRLENRELLMAAKHSVGSKEIDEYIIKHYPHNNAKVVADAFGLDEIYVVSRAARLGVKRIKGKNTVERVEIEKPPTLPRIEVKGHVTVHRCI
jgi:hypothetical protein